jgi:hypothetical protein
VLTVFRMSVQACQSHPVAVREVRNVRKVFHARLWCIRHSRRQAGAKKT